MSWKFFLYDWGGLNIALFQAINMSTPAALEPLASFFNLVIGNLELSHFDGHFFMESRESRPVEADYSLSRLDFSPSIFFQNCWVINIPTLNACELGCTMTRSR